MGAMVVFRSWLIGFPFRLVNPHPKIRMWGTRSVHWSLLSLLIKGELVGDDPLQGVIGDVVVGDFADRDLTAVDEEHRGLVYVNVLAELDGGIDWPFGGGGVGAGADLDGIKADLGDGVGEGRVGGLRGEAFLRGEDGVGELEEGLVAS